MLRLYNTLRYLRREQFLGQLRKRCAGLCQVPRSFRDQQVPVFPGCRWQPVRDFLPPPPGCNTPKRVMQGRFCFQGQEVHLGRPIDWQPIDVPLLWTFNLHYFDFLWGLDFSSGRDLVEEWIVQYPLEHRNSGWQSYPTSIRLANWCCFFFGKHREQIERDSPFASLLWSSVYIQVKWLRSHLEYDLMANHLFENAATLALVGSCFSDTDAAGWHREGCDLLKQELSEQMLEDGAHYERSPMYQTRIAHVLAWLFNTGDTILTDLVARNLQDATTTLLRLCHPDGQVALFNDSAHGVYASPPELAEYVEVLLNSEAVSGSPAIECFALPSAGYYGARLGDNAYLLCDAGPLGPDYNPGHGHGDLFSFELSLGGKRVVVDGGVWDYRANRMRQYCRSTAAHNTVTVNNCDQSEFWGCFRVARRARPHDVTWCSDDGGFRLSGWHDGYQRLRGKPRHHRLFRWHNDCVLMIRDYIRSDSAIQATSRIHLHPDCEIADQRVNSVVVARSGVQCAICWNDGMEVEIENSYYCSRFGERRLSHALAFHAAGDRVQMGYAIIRGTIPGRLHLSEGFTVSGKDYGW